MGWRAHYANVGDKQEAGQAGKQAGRQAGKQAKQQVRRNSDGPSGHGA
jgi:hypothetical protein